MAKKQEWEVPVNGKLYHVTCESRGNQFDFLLDGELLQRVWGSADEMHEQDVRIGGKVCQVAVYYGVPDVVVDGILMGVEAAERRNEKRRRQFALILGILLMCVGTFAVFSFTAMTLAGQSVTGGVFSLVFGMFFAGAGVWLLLRQRGKGGNEG